MNATSQNDQYDTTPPAPAHLESAMRKLREGAATAGQGLIPPRIYADECAALLAKIEAADRLATEVGKYRESLRLYGGGQLTDVKAALADYHNPAPAGSCTTCGGEVHHREGKPGEFNHQCNPAPAAEVP